MSADILHMNNYEANERAVDIAIPVVAVECEATPPMPNHKDAYEIAILRFVELGLAARGISKTLNATESLIESILETLKEEGLADKPQQKPWELTDAGRDFLKGEDNSDKSSGNSQYGYMFVNAIKKEIFPYFLEGDINQISLFRGKNLPYSLTINGNLKETFSEVNPKKSKLREAYKQFYKNKDVMQDLNEGNITLEEALIVVEDGDLFKDVDFSEDENSFDEAEIEEPETESLASSEKRRESRLTPKMFVRPLENSKKNVYLHMRMVIDPSIPGGYRVESPFNMHGLDNGYFLRQIQWLAANKGTKIGDENLQDFINREVRKISPSYSNQDKAFEVFALESMPLLKSQKYKHGNMYDDMARIYSLMQNQQSLLDKENIVGNISRSVLECLYNGFFKPIDAKKRKTISNQALADLKSLKNKPFIQCITKKTRLNPDEINWSFRFMKNAIERLGTTKGNSTVEKFINIVVVNYYIGTEETQKLLNSEYIKEIYEFTDELNQIRRKVSHDTDDKFKARDYDEFKDKVFELINWLLEVYREE